ncbi:Hsp20/alpha crystallin family protein [Ensifer sp. HO-A22]|uniref:Hsp20/alpha crystallin family protein n=1 Tax=Ensifer oleiphilus TaxID=2742698 RepID=A0A7Y6Q6A0_9HYPH|nr:Hsp20/alpha crystallin family protein [Ensifer oleiphilus]NVD39834.1 Hsp20/alpha crystallin family protein [Ensifer oleiphilus]
MAETSTKLPIKQEKETPARTESWMPFDSLRAEIDRLFDDFTPSFWRRSFEPTPARRAPLLPSWAIAPAVDLVEKEASYEITAELPGIEEKDIEVKVSNGNLSIRGEKQEDREQKDKEYVLSERRYGSFQRTFKLPEGIKADDIAATFSKGVLTVSLPKSQEALQNDRKIQIKAA